VSASDLSLTFFTLRMALLGTALILVPGVALAYLLARGRWPGKTLVETLATLPLALPPTAIGLVLLDLLGRHGPAGRWLDRAGLEIAFTWRGVAVAVAVMSFPLLLRSARTAFEEIDPQWEGLARTLGHGPLSVFFLVTLPLAMRGVLAGALLAFARALGEFGATILLAGNIPGSTQTLSLAIFQRIQSGREADAYRLVLVSTVLAFGAVWASGLLGRPRREAAPRP
jgi:molybdate transport system permease protein